MSYRKTSATRVVRAYEEKYELLSQQLQEHCITMAELQLFLRAFKAEQVLEVWVKASEDRGLQLLLEYPFCQTSGQPAPKRREGDKQIPEGIYHINRFNPESKFYLSLGLNYPNASDRILGDPERPGRDIFIHGGCNTVGCIPITDDKICELYVLAVEAKQNGQAEIPVLIFPCRMTAEKLAAIVRQYPEHEQFWNDLKIIFDKFEGSQALPAIEITADGRYSLTRS